MEYHLTTPLKDEDIAKLKAALTAVALVGCGGAKESKETNTFKIGTGLRIRFKVRKEEPSSI